MQGTGNFDSQVEMSVRYLSSTDARDSLHRNTYWPKWRGPWWHAALLVEMGLGERLPRQFLDDLVREVDVQYLKHFPASDAETPGVTDSACHCQLGTLFQVLQAGGIDPDEVAPWIRPWFLRYQLPDGGLNCDEAVYIRPDGPSSVVSTLPPLEAVLHGRRPFTPAEERFLDAGAGYLIARRLFRSARTGAVIDAAWLKPCFPRFYEYDLLRGLAFLTGWAEVRGRTLPRAAIAEAVEALEKNPGAAAGIRPCRLAYAGARTRSFEDGAWVVGEATTFELLEAVSSIDRVSPFLTRIWDETRARLARLETAGLLH